MYEHFQEDDDRNLVGKQLCTPDPGPSSVGGVATIGVEQGLLSQGCKDSTLYSPAAYGAVNTSGTIVGILGEQTGLLNGNANAGAGLQNSNLHDIASAIQPIYQSHQDIVDLHMAWDFTDHLRLESITGWDQNHYFYERDYARYVASVPFNATAPTGLQTCLLLFEPWLFGAALPRGPYALPRSFPRRRRPGRPDRSDQCHKSVRRGGRNQDRNHPGIPADFILQWPVNFSAGVNYTTNQDASSEYYVFFNSANAFEQAINAAHGPTFAIDNNDPPHNSGNNYFLSGGRSTKSNPMLRSAKSITTSIPT